MNLLEVFFIYGPGFQLLEVLVVATLVLTVVATILEEELR